MTGTASVPAGRPPDGAVALHDPHPEGADHAATEGARPLPDAVIDLRESRLAELVAGLTGCPPGGALHAVRTQARGGTLDDALEVVARAMVDVDQPPPEGFRVAGYLRDDIPLAHHRSLRRWDRSRPEAEPPR